jgi:hypothetical protein
MSKLRNESVRAEAQASGGETMAELRLTLRQRERLFDVIQEMILSGGGRPIAASAFEQMDDEEILISFDNARGILKDSGRTDAVSKHRPALREAGLALLPEDRLEAWEQRGPFLKAWDILKGVYAPASLTFQEVLDAKADTKELKSEQPQKRDRGHER